MLNMLYMLHGNSSNLKCLHCSNPCKKKNYANYAFVQSPGTAVCKQAYACNDPREKSRIKKDGGGRRLPHEIKKRRGGPCQKFRKDPPQDAKMLFCGHCLNCFHPRDTNISSCHISLAQYPKRYRKSFCCGLFEAKQSTL